MELCVRGIRDIYQEFCFVELQFESEIWCKTNRPGERRMINIY